LFTNTNGWAIKDIGAGAGLTDKRQRFVLMVTDGRFWLGETATQTGTYASVAAQASTYATSSRGGFYWRENNVVTVFITNGHMLHEGMSTGFDATSGTGVDAIVTPEILNAYYYRFNQAGADTFGQCNSRESVAVAFTNHGLNVGEQVYLTPSTGTLPAGLYTVIAIPGTNGYQIGYPHLANLTAGAATAIHTVTITTSAVHTLAIGNRVTLDFTSGTAPDGNYTIRTVPTTTTYTINCPLAAVTSGNFTANFDIGYVPPAGCKVRIPNIITRECSTGTRAVNNAPNGTQGTRPEFTTTSAGAIDLEFFCNNNWAATFGQAYSVRLINNWHMDTLQISECATAMTLDNVGVGMYGSLDINTLLLTSNFSGGTITNATLKRGNTPGTSDHAVNVNFCNNLTFNDCEFGIIQYARSSGYSFNLSSCDNITLNNNKTFNSQILVTTSNKVRINNTDYCDRFTGYTNATGGYSAINIDTRSSDVVVDGLTFGMNDTIPNCHPSSTAARIGGGANNVTFRNLGTKTNPLKCGSWNPNTMGMGGLFVTGGNCSNYRLQNCYVDRVRSTVTTFINSDTGVTYENVYKQNDNALNTFGIELINPANLNAQLKGFGGIPGVSGQASVYGHHFMTTFSRGTGNITLRMNEPTTDTAAYYTVLSGTPKFNSSGGVLMGVVGTSAVWEMPYFAKGFTGFDEYLAPTLAGSTLSNFLLEYDIDTGSGFSGTFKNLSRVKTVNTGANGAFTITIANTTGISPGDWLYGGTNIAQRNRVVSVVGTTVTLTRANTGTASGIVYFNHLPDETPNPAGTRFKVKVTCVTAIATAITVIRFNGWSNYAAHTDNSYPLDTVKLTLTGLVSGSDVVILQAGTTNIIASVDNYAGSSWVYEYETAQPVDIGVIKPGYVPLYIRNY